jgi:hypothetical protein
LNLYKKIRGSLFMSCIFCFCRFDLVPNLPDLNLVGCRCGNIADKGWILSPSPMSLTPCKNHIPIMVRIHTPIFQEVNFPAPHISLSWLEFTPVFEGVSFPAPQMRRSIERDIVFDSKQNKATTINVINTQPSDALCQVNVVK